MVTDIYAIGGTLVLSMHVDVKTSYVSNITIRYFTVKSVCYAEKEYVSFFHFYFVRVFHIMDVHFCDCLALQQFVLGARQLNESIPSSIYALVVNQTILSLYDIIS
jgi:pentose-5-phosphate-3-epimerase